VVVVYRVNWLQAKACADRWKEELKLVPKKMVWTINSYNRERKKWLKRGKNLQKSGGKAGHVAYAFRMVASWERLATVAKGRFENVGVNLVQEGLKE
jgi:hypothetical protein